MLRKLTSAVVSAFHAPSDATAIPYFYEPASIPTHEEEELEDSSSSKKPEFNIDDLELYGPKPSLLPRDFPHPYCLARCSDFYTALVAKHAFTPRRPLWAPCPPREGQAERCSRMVKWDGMSDPVFAEIEAAPSEPPAEHDHAPSPKDEPLYTPHGRWEWAAESTIDNPQTIKTIYTESRIGNPSYQLKIKTGTIKGQDIKYWSKSWSLTKAAGLEGLKTELAVFKFEQYLKPLQGDVVPYIIGMHISVEEINMNMELPHPSFWMEASSDMPRILKTRCIAAWKKIHARGVLHGDPELRNMLISTKGHVKIINFHKAKALNPDPESGLEKAEEVDLRWEMRKVKVILNYGHARVEERSRMQDWESMISRNGMRKRQLAKREQGMNVGRIWPEVLPNKEDLIDPPLLRSEWAREWDIRESKEYSPIRIVVPPQTEEELAVEVGKFMHSLISMSKPRPKRASVEDESIKHEKPSDCSLKRKLPDNDDTSESTDNRSPKRLRDLDSSATLVPSTSSSKDSTGKTSPKRPRELDSSATLIGSTPTSSMPSKPVASSTSVQTSPNRVEMWYSHLPDDAEVPRRPHIKRQCDPSSTSLKVRRFNYDRCMAGGYAHPGLVEQKHVAPSAEFTAREERKERQPVALGTYRREAEERLHPGRRTATAISLRQIYPSVKEVKNRYIAGCVGLETPVGGDHGHWQALLYAGERLDIPEGPPILTRETFERRQETHKNAVVRSSRAPRGILKRRRDDDVAWTADDYTTDGGGLLPDDVYNLTGHGDEEHTEVLLEKLEQYRKLGIPLPRKKIRRDGATTDVAGLARKVRDTPTPLVPEAGPTKRDEEREVAVTSTDVISRIPGPGDVVRMLPGHKGLSTLENAFVGLAAMIEVDVLGALFPSRFGGVPALDPVSRP